jgi:hypothetical protein
LAEIGRTREVETVRSILSLLAIERGARTHARFMLIYSDEELLDLEEKAME